MNDAVLHSFELGSLPVSLAMGLEWSAAFVVFAMIATACFGSRWLFLNRKREHAVATAARPNQMDRKSHPFFADKSDVLTLTEEEETLLITLTDELELTSPALLFVEPKHLQARSQDESDDSECAMMLLPKLYGKVTYVEDESKDE